MLGLFFFHVNKPRVDELSAGGLVAMDTEDVSSGLKGFGGFPRQREFFVIAGIAVHLQDLLAVDIDFGIFIMMKEELGIIRLCRQSEFTANPNIGAIPASANGCT